jgi:hypothetical protein
LFGSYVKVSLNVCSALPSIISCSVTAVPPAGDFKNIGTGVIHEDFTPRTYEEAELACLIKLIEIVKTFNSK